MMMLGWKSVSETLKNTSIEDAKMFLRQERYIIKNEGEQFAVLLRKGTQFTIEGKKVSLEVALVQENTSVIITLRYDTFVLFDTGDLQDELTGLCQRIKEKSQSEPDVIELFKALSDEKRLNVLINLNNGPKYSHELAELVGLKPTTMSHHMSKLMAIGVVRVSQGERNKSIYTLSHKTLKTLLADSYDLIFK